MKMNVKYEDCEVTIICYLCMLTILGQFSA